MAQCFTGGEPVSFDHFFALIQSAASGKFPSTVRISLGLATTFADVYQFLRFARGFLDRATADLGPAALVGAAGGPTRDAG